MNDNNTLAFLTSAPGESRRRRLCGRGPATFPRSIGVVRHYRLRQASYDRLWCRYVWDRPRRPGDSCEFPGYVWPG